MTSGNGNTPQMALEQAMRAGIVVEEHDSTYYCNACKRSLKTKATVKSHLRSQMHLNKTSVSSTTTLAADTGTVVKQKQPTDPNYRQPCDKNLKTKSSTKSHPTSKSHLSKSSSYDASFHMETTKKSSGISTTRDELTLAIDDGVVVKPRQPQDPYYCRICDKNLKTKYTMKTHLTTKTHLSKSPGYDSSSCSDTTKKTSMSCTTRDELALAIDDGVVVKPRQPQDPYYCRPCDKNLKTKYTMKTHLTTKTHLSKSSARYDSPDHVDRPTSKVTLTNATKNDLSVAVSDGVVVEPKKPGEYYYCQPCSKYLKTKYTMKSHLVSQAHLSKASSSNSWVPVSRCSFHITARDDDEDAVEEEEEVEEEESAEDEEEVEGETDDYDDDDEVDDDEEEELEEEEDEEDTEEEEENEVTKAIRGGVIKDDSKTTPNYPYYCNVCSQPLVHYGRLAPHLISKKHRTKVDAVARPRNDRKTDLPEFMYSDDYPSRGSVYVFNVKRDRPGAEVDTKNIKETFQKLDYKVTIYEDFTKQTLYNKIAEITKDSTLKNARALILFILSHGNVSDDRDTFMCRDNEIADLLDIKRNFTDSNCPFLKGKPKIIFTNFCRGKIVEEYYMSDDGQSSSKDPQCKKNEALVDIVVVYACTEGMKALRTHAKGTVFVQSLCEVLSSTEIPKKFVSPIFYYLHSAMTSKKGTTPMIVDHVFREFMF